MQWTLFVAIQCARVVEHHTERETAREQNSHQMGRRTARTAKITRIIEKQKAPPPQQGPDITHEPAAVRAAAARHGERTLAIAPLRSGRGLDP